MKKMGQDVGDKMKKKNKNTLCLRGLAFTCNTHQHKHTHHKSEYLETCQHMLTPTPSECPDNLHALSQHLNLPRIAPEAKEKKKKQKVLLIPVAQKLQHRGAGVGTAWDASREKLLSPPAPTTPSKHPDTLKVRFFFPLRSLFPV